MITINELTELKKKGAQIVVYGKQYGNEIGKGYIEFVEYTGFKGLKGALILFTPSNEYGFVSYKDIKPLRHPKFATKKKDIVNELIGGLEVELTSDEEVFEYAPSALRWTSPVYRPPVLSRESIKKARKVMSELSSKKFEGFDAL